GAPVRNAKGSPQPSARSGKTLSESEYAAEAQGYPKHIPRELCRHTRSLPRHRVGQTADSRTTFVIRHGSLAPTQPRPSWGRSHHEDRDTSMTAVHSWTRPSPRA